MEQTVHRESPPLRRPDGALVLTARQADAPTEGNADWFAALGYGVPMCIGAMALAAVAGLPAHVLGVAWFGVGLCVMSVVGYLASITHGSSRGLA